MPLVFGRLAFAALLFLAPGEPPSLRLSAEGLDPVALESGMRVRVGDGIDEWDIEVRATSLRGTYEVELRGPDRPESRLRVVSLMGETDEDRSRELAATLALIIMESPAPDPEPPPEHEPDPEPAPAPEPQPEQPFVVPRVALSLEGHVGLGPPRAIDMDLGVGLGAGVWLARQHLQPRLRAWWSRSWGEQLHVDGVSVGAGLAAGGAIGRWWIGVLALPSFKWTRGFDRKPAVALSGGGEATALVQYRRRHWLVGLRTGVETTFRPVLVRGSNDVIRWGPVRWLLVLEFGVGLGRVELR